MRISVRIGDSERGTLTPAHADSTARVSREWVHLQLGMLKRLEHATQAYSCDVRLPFSMVYRAFPEFDGLSEEDCRRYLRGVIARRPGLVRALPAGVALGLFIVWPVAWVVLAMLLPIARWVPMPASLEGRLILLVVSTVLVSGISGLLVRDFALWWGMRAEVNRARCPKCGQSLMGVPVQTLGAEGDPASRYVRCPECGRKYGLLDIGITVRELIPFEQRAVPEDFAKVKVKGEYD